MVSSLQDVTQLLVAWSNGDQTARDQLLPLVYGELRRMARRYMSRQAPDHTLQTTALIHEAYLKLADQSDLHWQNRAHFFAVAAQAMRQILVDHARARATHKRRPEMKGLLLDGEAVVSAERAAEIVALDEALTALASQDQRKSQVVELRFFGGLNMEETAEVLQVSAETVKRDWRLAKLWLLREMAE
ncbi:MAG: sigma-70 family RNA polymerase sigma factor [Candidatus Binatia bacterium]